MHNFSMNDFFISDWRRLDKFMSKDRNLGGKCKQTFIFVTGDKYRPQQTFVIFENNCITTSSLLKSVDTCFKLTYVLNLEFSKYCKNV